MGVGGKTCKEEVAMTERRLKIKTRRRGDEETTTTTMMIKTIEGKKGTRK